MSTDTTGLSDFQRRRATRRFEAECARLRPLGEAFVMRRFSGKLNRADAEDAVSDVLIRIHRLYLEGRPPRNLQATFFTSVRNAAIDQLRSRASKPTVGLDAASDQPADGATPTEFAESREVAARMQEALGRMRPNYREAIVLRFGAGMTIPEIARHKGMSLTAAKKLVVRATGQARDRVLDVTSAEHCEQLQRFAREGVVDEQLAGAEADQTALFEKHVAHCGHCRRYLSDLNASLHDYGSGLLLSGAAADHLVGGGLADRVAAVAARAGEAAQGVAEKARLAAYKSTGTLGGGDATAGGALAGTGQKIAAACATGATAATCVAAGVVPGVGASAADRPERPDSAPAVAEAERTPSDTTLPELPLGTPAPSSDAQPRESTPTPTQQVDNEIGIEQQAAAQASSGSSSASSEFGGPASGGGGSGSSGGSGGFGFEK